MSTNKKQSTKKPPFAGSKVVTNVKSDYGNDFGELMSDVLAMKTEKGKGEEVSDSDEEFDTGKEKKKPSAAAKKIPEGDEGKDQVPYMLFDFRRGADNWPKNCQLVDPKTFEDLVTKASKAAEKLAAKSKTKKDGEAKEDEGGGGRGKGISVGWSAAADSDEEDENEENNNNEKTKNENKKESGATFETLRDGSTALILPAGHCLKLNLADLPEGGDANREERQKRAAKEKKRMSKYASEFVGFDIFGKDGLGLGGAVGKKSSGGGGKKTMNEYTITMDIKLLDQIPREGISLYQTALVHCLDNRRANRVMRTINQMILFIFIFLVCCRWMFHDQMERQLLIKLVELARLVHMAM